LQDSLSALLSLSQHEKETRGLIDTPHEIQQQPATWRGTLHQLSSLRASLQAFLVDCGCEPSSPNQPGVILVGAGTSDYTGRSVRDALHAQWQCEVAAIPSTTLLTNMDDIILDRKQYLMISFSRSGESSEGVAVLKQALVQYPGQIRHLVVTCNASSTMASLPGVFTIKLDDAVNDRGLAMTSSFSNMVIAGQFLAHVHAPHLYAPLLQSLVQMGETLLPEAANTAASLAKRKFSRVCFLGTGSLQAVAQESALKVLELNAGKIATLAESPLGLRHGPMSFLNKETLVVAYLSSNDYRRQYELDLLEEIRSKDLCGEILVVAPHITDHIRKLTQSRLALNAPSDFPDACRAPVDVIAGQLLALFFAIENGITPDTPSDGAITRVVSHVKIYPTAGRNTTK
jgi:tagatose-6-phosphate ketose/aldose isomerase